MLIWLLLLAADLLLGYLRRVKQEVSADKDKEKAHCPKRTCPPPLLPPGLKQSRLFTNQVKRQPLNGGPWPLTWPWRGAAAAAAL